MVSRRWVVCVCLWAVKELKECQGWINFLFTIFPSLRIEVLNTYISLKGRPCKVNKKQSFWTGNVKVWEIVRGTIPQEKESILQMTLHLLVQARMGCGSGGSGRERAGKGEEWLLFSCCLFSVKKECYLRDNTCNVPASKGQSPARPDLRRC